MSYPLSEQCGHLQWTIIIRNMQNLDIAPIRFEFWCEDTELMQAAVHRSIALTQTKYRRKPASEWMSAAVKNDKAAGEINPALSKAIAVKFTRR